MREPDLIGLFVEPLNRLAIEYMVSGAVASIVYGDPRLTNDVDIVIHLNVDDVDRLTSEFSQEDFYVPPRDVIEDARRAPRGHFNLIHKPTSMKADFYPRVDDSLSTWAFEHRREVRTESGTMWIAPPEYVIVLKLVYWHDGKSEKHLRDIQAILRVLDAGVDRDLISREAEQRGVMGEWVRAKQPIVGI